jgi:hypothetical protein
VSGTGRDELEGKLRAAFRILGDYARVLGRHEAGGVLIAESELPAGRDAVKACILLAAAYRIANGASAAEIAPPARVSYATLAHFVPDAVARREGAFLDSAEAALGHAARKEAAPASLASAMADAPVAGMEAARAEYATLEAEFDAALARLLSEFGKRD